MFKNWLRERAIRRVLRAVARQRVALILQPGNVWVIEKSPTTDEATEAALRTCHLRGWVEPLADAVPKGRLRPDGSLPEGSLFSDVGPMYRLTEGGWAIINASHKWVIFGVAVAVASLIASIVGIVVVHFFGA